MPGCEETVIGRAPRTIRAGSVCSLVLLATQVDVGFSSTAPFEIIGRKERSVMSGKGSSCLVFWLFVSLSSRYTLWSLSQTCRTRATSLVAETRVAAESLETACADHVADAMATRIATICHLNKYLTCLRTVSRPPIPHRASTAISFSSPKCLPENQLPNPAGQ